MQPHTFHLKIASREGTLFEGDVKSISSYNEVGKFDVLPEHANFISLLNKSVQIVDVQGNTREITFNNALMKVIQNDVKIYMGIEWLISTNPSNSDTL